MTLPQQTSQQQSQHFLLKWNNHRSNMVNVFESLLTAEDLVDVTIAVEGKFLKAHKIVLSACSPYFQAMFVNHTPTDRYPILLFHDIKFAHLKTLLDFMYRGEISIDEKDLGDVLKVAEALSIRGLSSFESDDEEGDSSKPDGQQGQGQHGSGIATENSAASSSQDFDSHGGSTSSSKNSNAAVNDSNSVTNQHGKSNHKQKGTKSKNKVVNSHLAKRQHHQIDNSSGGGSCDASTMARSATGAKEKKGSATNSIKCEPDISPPSNITTTMEKAAAEVLPIKKKRGRAKKIVDPPSSSILPQRPTTAPHQYTNTKTPSKLQSTSKSCATTPTKSSASSLPPRHGVRRRIPRRYPGIPTRFKRVKLSKQPYSADGSESGGNNGANASSEQNPYDEIDDALLQQMLEGEDCEPLSEMSVRGLDLFKYASVENNVYRCIECEKLRIPKTFKNKYSFQRHAFLYHEGNMRKVFPCPVCSREFSRPDKMKNHMRSVHDNGVNGNGKDGGGGAGFSSENGGAKVNDSSTKMELDVDDTLLRNENDSSCDS